MVVTDGDFLRKLISTFKIEAEEHHIAIAKGLVALEHASDQEEQRTIIEEVFREAHSMKGAARAVNASGIEQICQGLEDVFAGLKRERRAVIARDLFDTLHRALNALVKLLTTLEGERPAVTAKETREIVRQLHSAVEVTEAGQPAADAAHPAIEQPFARSLRHNSAPHRIVADPPPAFPEPAITEKSAHDAEAFAAAPAGSSPPAVNRAAGRQRTAPAERPAQSKTIRIATAKLDSLLLQSEELLSAKLTARQRSAELRELKEELNAWKDQWSRLRKELRPIGSPAERPPQGGPPADPKADARIHRLFEFIDRNSSYITSFDARLTTLAKSAEKDQRALGGMIDHLLADLKEVLMLPVASLLEMFPKVVRDLGRDRGKEIELIVRGGETEADRRILEGLKDPLLHLVRNAVDHGIEQPAVRLSKRKRARGQLVLAVAQKSGREIEVTVSDDGAGIEAGKVKEAALRNGAHAPDELASMDARQTHALVFHSGVSTSPLITNISGRGLGLAIVQEKVEKLGGTVTLESQPDVGTTFRICVPLTIATFRGILVRTGGRHFIFPTAGVRHVLKIRGSGDIDTIENRETICFDGQLISLVRLGEVLELPPADEATTERRTGHAHAVILDGPEQPIAFLVDEVIDEQEVLVKKLGYQLSRVRNITGATLLGRGEVVPVLNVTDLMRSALIKGGLTALHAAATAAAGSAAAAAGTRSILVAEDSITARTLLKNILEVAGYRVTTAIDGAAALSELKKGDFDLLISDVEMPVMGGFELTAQVRADERLAELPVVLVTSLDSREDRERGIDAGADAYLVKSNFDQSNLLATVRQLI